MNADLESCLEVAQGAARKAASAIRAAGPIVERELERDRKLRADCVAEDVILAELRSATPYRVVSEESGTIGETEGNWSWIVDPLDGSVNFSQSIPICAVSIALWERDTPMLGVIYDFHRDELFSGFAGGGATLNGDRISVAASCTPAGAILCTGFPAGGDFSGPALTTAIARVRGFKKIRLLGCAALSLAYVAAGRVHAYAEEGIRLWDVAAGIAIVRAAGGVVNWKLAGNPGTYFVTAGCCDAVVPS